jgi:hypothetical protein
MRVTPDARAASSTDREPSTSTRYSWSTVVVLPGFTIEARCTTVSIR